MDMHAFAQRIHDIAHKALSVDPVHGHAERLTQAHGALEEIKQVAAEHLPADEEITEKRATR